MANGPPQPQGASSNPQLKNPDAPSPQTATCSQAFTTPDTNAIASTQNLTASPRIEQEVHCQPQVNPTSQPPTSSASRPIAPKAVPPITTSIPPQSSSASSTAGSTQTQGYYAVSYPPSAWQNAWQVASYPYTSSPSSSSYTTQVHSAGGGQPPHYSQLPYAQYYAPPPTGTRSKQKKVRTPSPSPPPPTLHRHWDGVLRAFLERVGFGRALRGFDEDMLVMSTDWERQRVPGAIGELMKDLMTLGKFKEDEEPSERSLEDRKLNYVHTIDGVEPRSQTSVIKEVSGFLARSRARNDTSNRAEFIESLTQKRRRLNPPNLPPGPALPQPAGQHDAEIEVTSGPSHASNISGGPPRHPSAMPDQDAPDNNTDADATDHRPPTCARTDAKTQDRDRHMTYDIMKNEGGPLQRTVKGLPALAEEEQGGAGKTAQIKPVTDDSLSEEQPAMDERVRNVEVHLGIRYVPGRPRKLLDRLKHLEDYLAKLEREYPPWAALHFNQPNRGWPPPPRATPIIVPSHLASFTPTSSVVPSPAPGGSLSGSGAGGAGDGAPAAFIEGRKLKNTGSSLHRAVMEKLEVQRAIDEMKRGG
ncbi:hypothetical protein CONPUDRAFT_121481 [Coniophora puteana RWD-64-598 SS2]|uniref:Uncharacterized protein n=1 Tax=Coniophora puteana (strain RWD-64-598) TaxID=741705 RepID=A0A5M3MVL6_CONPW|nr:uncharacterized protein CONPUDRAFT_121481 [Coniophora puteana RWD-64-598 SS2]EIW83090.1 hypothetical protein CONPUDRAFT_121481 [Coniophora puteana RWD-64-598 SS2]